MCPIEKQRGGRRTYPERAVYVGKDVKMMNTDDSWNAVSSPVENRGSANALRRFNVVLQERRVEIQERPAIEKKCPKWVSREARDTQRVGRNRAKLRIAVNRISERSGVSRNSVLQVDDPQIGFLSVLASRINPRVGRVIMNGG